MLPDGNMKVFSGLSQVRETGSEYGMDFAELPMHIHGANMTITRLFVTAW